MSGRDVRTSVFVCVYVVPCGRNTWLRMSHFVGIMGIRIHTPYSNMLSTVCGIERTAVVLTHNGFTTGR